MRPLEQRNRIRDLRLEGRNVSEIARITGISRTTVREWLAAPAPTRLIDSCPRCGHPTHDFSMAFPAWYAYLLGMYLGDGTISSGRRGVYVLRIYSDLRYPEIIFECSHAMRVVMPTSRVTITKKAGCADIKSYSKAWACLFPQHGPGRKHLRRIELAAWQQAIVDAEAERFVRGLLHSDGSRVINRVNGGEYPRYFFDQVSDDIRRLFCASLKQLGVEYTWPRADVVSIARRASVARLDEFVGPKR